MNTVIVGLGSNVNAEENIDRALEVLGADFHILGVSKMVQTKPIGITNQAEFTNGAVKFQTKLKQEELQNHLKKIEDLLGRDRTVAKFGPRTIDLDIVVWNGKVVDNDYWERDFLQKSVAQLGVDIKDN